MKPDDRIARLSPEKRALLARMLAEKAAREPPDAITRRGDGEPREPSFAQERLWFLDQLDPQSPLYTIGAHFEIAGPLDEGALEGALADAVARHEALRATLVAEDGVVAVSVAEPAALPLRVVDLCEKDAAEQDAEVIRRRDEEASTGLSLRVSPLLRAVLLRLAQGRHVLLLTVHHAASDGWSMSLLLSEISTFYKARKQGVAPTLPPLSIAYSDFAAWQRRRLLGPLLDREMAYWREHLAEAPSLLHLPTDRPRPAIQRLTGGRVSARLSPALRDRLTSLAAAHHTTLFATLLAGLFALLHRLSGESDLVIGTPVAGRLRTETESLVGLFVNTLALRARMGDDPPFSALIERVHAANAKGQSHQELPFEKLVEELSPTRSRAHSPIFQVMFILQNAPRAALTIEGARITPLLVDNHAVDFDLNMAVVEEDGGLDVTLRYATALFDEATIERMLRSFEGLLEAASTRPETRLSALPLMSRAERARQLTTWNDTSMPFPEDACVHELIVDQARKTPTRWAVSSGDQRITYAELDAASEELAGRLAALGVGPEVRVGVCVTRSVGMVVAVLGILRAGGAYVPLDPEMPKARLAFMAEDAGLGIVVTQPSILDRLPERAWEKVFLGAHEGEAHAPIRAPSPQNAAYAIYTSGSTGRPKGVVIPHRALVSFLFSMRDRPGISADDVLLSVTSLSFDIAGLELYLPLLVGAEVVVATASESADGKVLATRIAETGATILQATPASFQLLLRTGWQGSDRLAILCGGEAFPPSLARDLQGLGRSVWNLFGPTETTIWSSVHRVTEASAPVPVGLPIGNTTLFVLDERMEPLPLGVTGELFIGGVGLARGYLGRAGLTAERFVPNPFGSAGERLYRTGDLAERRPSGEIVVVGRTDHQVKLRGYRIELGEIAAVLREHPSVVDAAAAVSPGEEDEKRLVGYVVLSDASTDASALRRHTSEKLPPYMVPSDFVVLERLPLTQNGKLDRSALPPPSHNAAEAITEAAPADLLELSLQRVWEHVLRRRPVPIDASFFDLGGHSLLAASLFAQMAKVIGRELPLATLFEAPTIAGIARLLREESWKPPWSSLVPMTVGTTRPPFYCVHAVGGNLLIYRPLVARMGQDQPFYGLQSIRFSRPDRSPEGIEEVAAEYIREICRANPVGPYYLGGYSLGGLIAFEMARQLRREGRQVALLALLDTFAPGYPDYFSLPERTRARAQKIARLGLKRGATHALHLSVRALQDLWPEHVPGMKKSWPVLKQRIAQGRPLSFLLDLRDYRATIAFATNLVRGYKITPYDGKITLFRAETQPIGARPDATSGWSRYATEVEVVRVPGDHRYVMQEPEVGALSAALRAAIDRAAK